MRRKIFNGSVIKKQPAYRKLIITTRTQVKNIYEIKQHLKMVL